MPAATADEVADGGAGEGGRGGDEGDEGPMIADTGPMPTDAEIGQCLEGAEMRGQGGACVECGCEICTAAVLDCQDDACQSVVDCGLRHGCFGDECYCGEGVTADECIGRAKGPCMEEIVTASGFLGMPQCTEIEFCAVKLSNLPYNGQDNPVERARQVSVCTQGQRENEGVPGFVLPAPEILGHCMDECN